MFSWQQRESRIAFAANGKREILVYIFLKKLSTACIDENGAKQFWPYILTRVAATKSRAMHIRERVAGTCSPGGTPDFKWRGWSNGEKNQNPRKSLDQKLTPKKSYAEFPSLKY